MNILSLSHFWEMFRKPAQKYPLAVLFSFMFSFVAVYSNHLDYAVRDNWLPAIVSFGFGFLLSVAFDLFMEARGADDAKKSIGRLLVLAIVGVSYWFLFRSVNEWLGWQAITAILMFAIVFVGVFVAPFFVKEKFLGFWNHTVSFIGRVFTSILLYGVLFLGIAMLMQSVDFLFEVNIDGKYYMDVWLVLAGILAPMYVLSGMPDNWKSLEKQKYYPKILKFLTQYLLVPLVFAYFVVLYLYTGKIVLTWNWPNGDVANWIIAFSGVGVLTYFFASKKEDFLPYVEPFKKLYFWALIPQLVVLFMAIGIRIGQYGVTEARYFVVLAGVLLLFNALYFLFSRVKDLKVMAFSLMIALLFSIVGPWSAVSVSKWSQMNRFESLLVENNLLVDGKVVAMDSEAVSYEVYDNIYSLVGYLTSVHGEDDLKKYFDEKFFVEDGWYYGPDSILGLMFTGNKRSVEGWNRDRYFYSADFCRDGGCAVDVKGYDYLISIYDTNGVKFDNVKFSLTVDGNELVFMSNENEQRFSLANVLRQKSDSVPAADLTFDVSTPDLDGKLEIESLSLSSGMNKYVSGRLKFNLK